METERLGEQFISTGVDGLDYILGGFPKGSLIILAGNPGTGKTILSAKFLYHGAVEYNESGVYFSSAESKEVFFKTMKIYGFDFEKLEREGKFNFLDFLAAKEKLSNMLVLKEPAAHVIINEIIEAVDMVRAKRLVIDSFTALAQSFKDLDEVRMVTNRVLSRVIRRMGCTTILIEEVPYGEQRIGFGVEEFIADGVLVLRTSGFEGYRLRELEIPKMRGVKLKETKLIFTLEGGFKAFPPFTSKPIVKKQCFQPTPDPPSKYSTGSKSFDDLLEGGLPRGFIMLLEIDEKVSTDMYHLLVAPMVANFISQGRGAFIIPSMGVTPLDIYRTCEVYGMDDAAKQYLTVVLREEYEASNIPLNFISVKAEDWRKDMNIVMDAAYGLMFKINQPPILVVGTDSLITLYGEKQCEEILNLVASTVRFNQAGLVILVKAGFRNLAVKLSAISDIYARLTREHGCLLFYCVKPRIGLCAVEYDASKAYPIAKLTPIL